MINMKQTANQNQKLLQGKLWQQVICCVAALLMLVLPAVAFAQNKTITGKVTNANGTPVAGATVQVKGTTSGTTTDNSGNFSIAASKGSTLLFSNVGFSDREVVVGDNTT